MIKEEIYFDKESYLKKIDQLRNQGKPFEAEYREDWLFDDEEKSSFYLITYET